MTKLPYFSLFIKFPLTVNSLWSLSSSLSQSDTPGRCSGRKPPLLPDFLWGGGLGWTVLENASISLGPEHFCSLGFLPLPLRPPIQF